MTTKISTWAAALLACAAVACNRSASAAADPQMACVERLEVPTFPRIAEDAQVEAGVNAAVLLGKEGAVEKVSLEVSSGMEYAGKLFFSSIDKALKSSKFAAGCSGRTVRMSFDFPLPVKSETGETVQTVRFKHPNRFEIALTPAPVRWYTTQ